MNIINSISEFLNRLLQWWFTVMPWEQAIHIRRGKVKRILGGGLYLRIPFIDSVFVQTTRMRMIDMSMQTMTTKDGSAVTIKGALGYSIKDMLKLFNTLYHPDTTMVTMMQGLIADEVRKVDTKDLSPSNIEQQVHHQLKQVDYGIGDISVKITTFAVVKTFRIIQDGSWVSEGLTMNPKQ